MHQKRVIQITTKAGVARFLYTNNFGGSDVKLPR